MDWFKNLDLRDVPRAGNLIKSYYGIDLSKKYDIIKYFKYGLLKMCGVRGYSDKFDLQRKARLLQKIH